MKNPTSITTFKDTLLLIADEGFISMLDMTNFPPLPSDFKDYTIDIPEFSSASNSVCAVRNPTVSSAASNLNFISMNSENINMKTIISAAV